jgi:hypothetical protein
VGGIFISYRRGDSEGQATALSLELANYIGDKAVFMDVDSIPLDATFARASMTAWNPATPSWR